MHCGRGFGLRSHSGTLTSPATGYPLGLWVLDTQTLEICGPELAEPALNFFPRVDYMLMPDLVASYFVELGPPLGAH